MNDYSNNSILKEINFARTKPKEYAEKLLGFKENFKGDILRIPGHTAIKTLEGFKAFEEAADVLNKQSPLGPIIFNTFLSKISEDALAVISNSDDADAANTIDLDELISKHGQIAGQFSQAVDFGSFSSETVVINLLVDDGDVNRGNRANILNPKFCILGIATGKHKTFHNVTVICFARHFIPTGEDPANLSDDCYETNDEKTNRENSKLSEQKKDINSVMNNIKNIALSENFKDEDNQPISVPPKYLYVDEKTDKENDFDLPKGIERMEKHEKVIIEEGLKRRLIKETRYMKDGSVETDIYKKDF
jgi:hypothetical protein